MTDDELDREMAAECAEDTADMEFEDVLVVMLFERSIIEGNLN